MSRHEYALDSGRVVIAKDLLALNGFIAALARLPLRMLPSSKVIRVVGGPLRGKRWIVGAGIHRCWLGFYELPKAELLARTVAPGQTVFDIGAHAGYYTVLAADRVGPAGRVVAFEPSQRNLRYLEAHLSLNGIVNARVVGAAVSDFMGEASFDGHGDSFQGRLSTSGISKVKVVSLDRLIEGGTLPLPDLVKIDVEGGEREVLAGAARLLKERMPVIFLATHGVEVHRECCATLEDLCYHLRTIATSRLDEASELLATRFPP
jgi:FkbM family methyltransferase